MSHYFILGYSEEGVLGTLGFFILGHVEDGSPRHLNSEAKISVGAAFRLKTSFFYNLTHNVLASVHFSQRQTLPLPTAIYGWGQTYPH